MLWRIATIEAAGFSATRTAAIGDQLERTARALQDAGHSRGPFPSALVPGRIEVLGKHTDYAGGRSLLCAVDRGFCTRWAARDDGRVVVVDVAGGASVATTFSEVADASGASWGRYLETVVRRLARNFPGMAGGISIAFASDLPAAAGLSSSSALLVSLTLACVERYGLERHPAFRGAITTLADFATYASCIENGSGFGDLAGDRGVGTAGGSEDHVAMLCCVPGHVGQYRFCPVRHEGSIALEPRWTFVVGVSGVVADKGGEARAAYNEASRRAARLLEAWRSHTGRTDATLADAIESASDAGERLRAHVRTLPSGDALEARLSQFIEEHVHVIPAAARALRDGDHAAFGALVDRSQAAAARGLGNQTPETIALADLARRSGAEAASSFGAGFGGSVWALVRDVDVDAFTQRWSGAYAEAFPGRRDAARFFRSRPGPGAVMIDPAA